MQFPHDISVVHHLFFLSGPPSLFHGLVDQLRHIEVKSAERQRLREIPLVNIQKNYGNTPFLMAKSTISVAIFKSKL
jgi:hypothetical protein